MRRRQQSLTYGTAPAEVRYIWPPVGQSTWEVHLRRLYYSVDRLHVKTEYFTTVKNTILNQNIWFTKQLGWAPFYHEAKINKSILVYKRILGECPFYLTQMLVRNVDVNRRTSRHGQLNLVCPRFKRETEGGRSFSVSTSRLWNMMPAHIKNQPNLASFKKSIFKHYMDSYKELDDFII